MNDNGGSMLKKLPSHQSLLKAGWVPGEAGDDLVSVTRVLAGHVSTLQATRLQHSYAAELVRQRQAAGYFTICEAAQELENLSLVPDAESFLKSHLMPSIRKGELRAYSASDRLPMAGCSVDPLKDMLTRDGLNDWLKAIGVPFRWQQEEGWGGRDDVTRFGSQLDPVESKEVEVLPVRRARRGDLLEPLIMKALKETTDEGGDGSAAIVFTRLRSWAIKKPPVPPLTGVTPDGIQWTNSKDEPRETSVKLLGERLGRLKKREAERRKAAPTSEVQAAKKI